MAKEILIVDSEKGNREEFKVIFEAADYNVVFLDSGEQALLRIKLFKPDLIILGASLKEKSGLEVFKAIKADIESKQIPVIFLSNLLKEISEEERERIQADGVITKPFHEDEILNLVDRLVEEVETGSKKEGIVGREMEWGSIADIGKARSEKEEEFLAEKG
jgi:DNA-binding response OmpR family regulator